MQLEQRGVDVQIPAVSHGPLEGLRNDDYNHHYPCHSPPTSGMNQAERSRHDHYNELSRAAGAGP